MSLVGGWLLDLVGRAATDDSLEVPERNHDDSNIVEGLPVQTVFEDSLDTKTAEVVHIVNLLGGVATQPDTAADVFIRHFVEDAITGKSDEVMLLRDLKDFDVRFGLHHVRIATTVIKFSLRVAESSTHRESTWQDPYWPNNELWINRTPIRIRWLLLLSTFRKDLGCSRLIDLAARLNYSVVLINIRWLVIAT